MAGVQLPCYAALQSCLSCNYMAYMDGGPLQGYISFTGDSVLSPFAKIAFEPSHIVPGCVHIRCCYNNKYWTRKSPTPGSPIVAEAKEPKPKEEEKKKDHVDGDNHGEAEEAKPKRTDAEEVVGEPKAEEKYDGANQDEAKVEDWGWDCTLFKVDHHPNGTISIRHISTGDYLQVKGGWEYDADASVDADADAEADLPEDADCLVCIKSIDPSQSKTALRSEEPVSFAATCLPNLFKVVNLSSFAVLPRYVAFKGDNGLYLQGRTIQRYPYLEFSSRDARNIASNHEVFANRDGTIRIKSKFFDRFWRRSPNWIWADSSDNSSSNRDTLFWPVQIGLGSNKVALRNLGNNRFCSRLTTEGKTSCLNADSPTARLEATLEVEELVLSREIYNVRFRLEDAKIYGERVIQMNTMTYDNRSSIDSRHVFRFSYKETTTTTWSASVSLSLGVQARIRAGIPILASGRITISAEVQADYTWGETKEVSREMEKIHEVNVPPMTRVIARLVASEGTFDVPFSYTQRDVLLDGTQRIYYLNDGLYSGGNAYNVHVEVSDEPLN